MISRRTAPAAAPDILPKPPDWTTDALCQQADPEMFYPEKGGSSRDAKRICAECPAVASCLAWALQHGEEQGVWGGLSASERRRLRRAAS